MSEIGNEDQLTAQGQELDDFDVEGHGLKEVAIGLSAASVVATGIGATALALDNPIPGTTAGIQATVAGVQKDVDNQRAYAERLAGGVVEQAGETAGGALRDVDRLSAWADRTVATTTNPMTQRVDAELTAATELAQQTVADTSELAGRALQDPIGTTDRVLDTAVSAAREIRDDALNTTRDAVATAERTVDAGVTTAEQATADVAETALSTVGDVQELVDPRAGATMDEESVTVQVGAAGTTITVSTG